MKQYIIDIHRKRKGGGDRQACITIDKKNRLNKIFILTRILKIDDLDPRKTRTQKRDKRL